MKALLARQKTLRKVICLLGLPLVLASGSVAHAVEIKGAPLVVSTGVSPNLLLAVDNSGSMDSEVLFPTNDGAAWWHTGDRSFVGRDAEDELVGGGVLNFNEAGSSNGTWQKYTYLFPNGTGDGNRVYGDSDSGNDHYAIPPTPPFAWARSSAYNGMYYNSDETYEPWVDGDSETFADAPTSSTCSDPVEEGACFDLFANRDSSTGGELFRFQNGMAQPDGTVTSGGDQSLSVNYFPATFYEPNRADIPFGSGSFNCNSPDPGAYAWFVGSWGVDPDPDPLSAYADVDAIAPDGTCLQKFEIKSGEDFPSGRDLVEEEQNFANWFHYYRKRHLALRAGMGRALEDFNNLRIGVFTINALTQPSMLSIDDSRGAIFDQIYAIGGNSAGTPNREAVKAAGDWFDASSDIIQYDCQKNATLLFTDGYSNPANTGVGNVDGGWGAPYADGFSNTMADTAARYYDEDQPLRSGESDFDLGQVPVPYMCSFDSDVRDPWLDCNSNLHMNLYGVSLGAKGRLFGETYFTPEDAYRSPPDWEQPDDQRSPVQVDDLYHATINARGELFNANNPEELENALKSALGSVMSQFGTAASLAANSTQLDTGTVTYQAQYFSGNWEGDLVAYEVDSQTGQIDDDPAWSAAAQLPAPSDRNLFTATVSADAGGVSTTKYAFTYAELPDELKDVLDLSAPNGASGRELVEYIRGDDSNDVTRGGSLRVRDSLIGDIVHSQPVYVGAPGGSKVGYDDYSDFAFDEQDRSPVVYVAANDGMLHGFDAETGVETFAYLPASVITGGNGASPVGTYADPQYGTGDAAHEYFNDGELTVADVNLGTLDAEDWATVLVGTTGRGERRTIYAIDVTDPSTPEVLWERTAGVDYGDDASDIGQMVGKPLIVRIDSGWKVLIGNGYNSTDGEAALLVIDVATGQLSSMVVPENGVADANGVYENGLAAPASFDLSTTPDGIQDVAYAGDLNGRLWKFDLTDLSSTPEEIFHALSSDGANQPITAGILLGRHPDTANLWAFFGTGRYLSGSDLTDDSVQTWYGLDLYGNQLNQGRNKLRERKIKFETAAGDDQQLATRIFSEIDDKKNEGGGDMNGVDGWFIDLVSPLNGQEGERMVVPNQFQGGVLIGTSLIPEGADPCNPSGRGFIMALDPFDGTNVERPFVDINGDGVVDENDVYTAGDGTKYAAGAVGFSRLPNAPIFVGNTMLVSFDDGSTASLETGGTSLSSGRVSWKEYMRGE